MENKFNFKSSVCTSREQSERLLALGLKIETADCYHWQETDIYGDGNGKWHCEILSEYNKDHSEYLYNVYGVDGSDEGFFIPAWSLHRLIEMMPKEIPCEEENGLGMYLGKRYAISYFGVLGYHTHENLYDVVILCIEDVIKEGYFNKEYLV